MKREEEIIKSPWRPAVKTYKGRIAMYMYENDNFPGLHVPSRVNQYRVKPSPPFSPVLRSQFGRIMTRIE